MAHDELRIKSMGSDQEINAAVARKLGWIGLRIINSELHGFNEKLNSQLLSLLPDYCHDIKAAWEIVEHCHNLGHVSCINYLEKRGQWHCNLQRVVNYREDNDGYADTVPMAICLAFLKLQ